jgi:hypothetical protein
MALSQANLDWQKERKAQSQQWILDSIHEWAKLFGHPPSATDWNPAHAISRKMYWKADRYKATGRKWPSPTLVRTHFGTWNTALKLCGYPPLTNGDYRDGRNIREVARSAVNNIYWTKEMICQSVRQWHDAYDRLPTSSDWKHASLETPRHPNSDTIYRVIEIRPWSDAMKWCLENS